MKFGYTILYVNDVEQTMRFYEAAFGLIRRFIHEGGYAEMDTGDTTLAFASFEVAQAAGLSFLEPSVDGPSHAVELAFVTDDVAAAFAQAVLAGAESVAEPTQKPWGQIVSYVRDINGFLVEVCSPITK